MGETWVPSLGWEDCPGEGKGYLLQYSCLENSMGCIVYGVTKSWTQLSLWGHQELEMTERLSLHFTSIIQSNKVFSLWNIY